MSTTPPCRCGHPSHYHDGGNRPWSCDVVQCDCPDWCPWPSDVAERIAKHLAVSARQSNSTPSTLAALALAPTHDADIDCETADGGEGVAHHWDLRAYAFGDRTAVQAYGSAVYLIGRDTPLEFDDESELLDLEHDALAILAAIARYRQWRAEP